MNWNPAPQAGFIPEVETTEPDSLIGVLFLPGDEMIEVRYTLPTFGFGRHLDETDC